MPTGKPITSELKQQVIKFYLSKPMSYKTVCEKFNLSYPTVIKILNGVKKYNKSLIFNPQLNEDLFKEINDEKSAYFLGLIISDGNVFTHEDNSGRQDSISITLQTDDVYILEEFKKWTNTNTSIVKDDRHKGAYSIALRSNKMSNNLKQWGIIPRKSFKTYLPNIKNEYMSHLIRGIFDGDGSIRFEKTSRRYLKYFTICGSEQLIEDIVNYINNNLNLEHNVKVYTYKDRCLFEFKISNYNDMKKFGDFIYKNSTIKIERKYKKFVDFCNRYNYHGNTEITKNSNEFLVS